MYQHALDATRGEVGPKADRIRAAGDRLQYLILGEYSSDEDACNAEKLYIASLPGLTNRTAGGEPGGLAPKERIRRHARRLLHAMVPLPEWLSGLTDEKRRMALMFAPTPEACYIRTRLELEKEASDPTPNMLTVKQDGRHEFGWC